MGPSGRGGLSRRGEKLDGEAAKALERFQQVEARRRETRATALWLADVQTAPGGSLEAALRRQPGRYVHVYSQIEDARNAGAMLPVAELVAGLRQFLDQTSSSSYAEGAEERASFRAREDALAALQATEPALAVRVSMTNELSLEQAIAISEGKLDLDAALDEHRARVAAGQEHRLEQSLPPAWR
jgi:hypothetical protein